MAMARWLQPEIRPAAFGPGLVKVGVDSNKAEVAEGILMLKDAIDAAQACVGNDDDSKHLHLHDTLKEVGGLLLTPDDSSKHPFDKVPYSQLALYERLIGVLATIEIPHATLVLTIAQFFIEVFATTRLWEFLPFAFDFLEQNIRSLSMDMYEEQSVQLRALTAFLQVRLSAVEWRFPIPWMQQIGDNHVTDACRTALSGSVLLFGQASQHTIQARAELVRHLLRINHVAGVEALIDLIDIVVHLAGPSEQQRFLSPILEGTEGVEVFLGRSTYINGLNTKSWRERFEGLPDGLVAKAITALAALIQTVLTQERTRIPPSNWLYHPLAFDIDVTIHSILQSLPCSFFEIVPSCGILETHAKLVELVLRESVKTRTPRWRKEVFDHFVSVQGDAKIRHMWPELEAGLREEEEALYGEGCERILSIYSCHAERGACMGSEISMENQGQRCRMSAR